MIRIACLVLLALMTICFVIGCAVEENSSITAFCGSASKPAMEEAAVAFEEKTGIKVFLNFGGSGTMLSQMKVTRSGDVYIPGSPDYMQIAVSDDIVDVETVAIISYLVPAILVQNGNPENIHQLSDLARDGIDARVGRCRHQIRGKK